MDSEASVTYQSAVARGFKDGFEEGFEEGRIEMARKVVFQLGRSRFGEPASSVSAQLERIADLDRLETLMQRALDAACWQDLLAEPELLRDQIRVDQSNRVS